MSDTKVRRARYGMVIDLDACTGCGACMVACAIENNTPPAHALATERTSLTPMRVDTALSPGNDPVARIAYFPVPCQQCGHEAPCMTVCPQNAVQVDAASGIVYQMAQRCLGCRYCMAACPYHARYFNWWDPAWPEGMERTLNPDVSVRMRGVAEKCNFCHGRLQAARAKAIADGASAADPVAYTPACVEACPMNAIVFGDLDTECEASREAAHADSFRLLPGLGTEPKVYYKTQRTWVREAAEKTLAMEGTMNNG